MNELLKSIYKKILELEKIIKAKESKDNKLQKKIIDFFESEDYKKFKN